MIESGYSPQDTIKNNELILKFGDGYEFIHSCKEYTKKSNELTKRITSENLSYKAIEDKVVIFRKIQFEEVEKIYSISIGDTRSIFDIYKTEMNFGLKIGINDAINLGDKINWKEIQSKNKTNGDNVKHGKNKFSSLSTFSFKKITDILTEAKMQRTKDDKKEIWVLNRAITIPIDDGIEIQDLLTITDELIIKNYFKESYKDNYSFLDDLSIVDNSLSTLLFNEVKKQLINETFNGGFAWPTFESEYHSFYRLHNSDVNLYTLDNDDVINVLKTIKRDYLNINIHSHSVEENVVIDSKPFKNIIFAELKYENKTYHLNEGIWYQVDSDFISKIDKIYYDLPKSNIDFPDWKITEDEGDYNENVSRYKKWIKLDKNNLVFENRNKLELADLAIKDAKTLIAVKNGKVSSGISHLVEQVRNSIWAIFSESERVTEKINAILGDGLKINNITDFDTFVLAIGTVQSYNKLPVVPFFAKISIYQLLSEYFGKPIKIEIAWIKRVE